MTLSNIGGRVMAQEQNPKVGVFLSGGGALGFAHIGMLQAMEEAGIYPQYVSGASMGALVGALYSAGYSPSEIKEIVYKDKLYKNSRLFATSGRTNKQWERVSLFTHKKVRKILEKHLHTDNFEDLEKHFMVAVSNLTNSCTEVIDSGDHLIDYLLASMSIPAVFEPVFMDGKIYVDGGSLNHFASLPIREKVDYLIGLDVMPPTETTFLTGPMNLITTYIHSVAQITGKEGREACDYLIDSYAIEKYKILDFKKFEEIYEYGYQLMKEYISKHPDMVENCGVKATIPGDTPQFEIE